eukprot:m.191495 g.191495  ORF g.191495 m.191495 type:complete len:182 (-) comp14844_c0_seq3:364-909(-)
MVEATCTDAVCCVLPYRPVHGLLCLSRHLFALAGQHHAYQGASSCLLAHDHHHLKLHHLDHAENVVEAEASRRDGQDVAEEGHVRGEGSVTSRVDVDQVVAVVVAVNGTSLVVYLVVEAHRGHHEEDRQLEHVGPGRRDQISISHQNKKKKKNERKQSTTFKQMMRSESINMLFDDQLGAS